MNKATEQSSAAVATPEAVDASADPAQGHLSMEEVEAQVMEAERIANGGEPAKADAEPDPEPVAADPEPDPEPVAKEPEKAKAPEKAEKAEKATDEKTEEGADDLPEDDEADSLLDSGLNSAYNHIKSLEKSLSSKGREASDAGKRASAAEMELRSRKSVEEKVDSLLENNPELDNIITAALEKKIGAKADKEEAGVSTSEDDEFSTEDLRLLAEENPEQEPIIKALLKSKKNEAVASAMYEKLSGRIESLEATSSTRDSTLAQERIEDRRFDQYNFLSKNYPHLSIGRDLDAETLEAMVKDGRIQRDSKGVPTDPYYQKVLKRASRAFKIVHFAEVGPHGKGTADDPYYPDIDIAYQVLEKMAGRGASNAAKARIAGRKEGAASIAAAGAASPSIRDLTGKGKASETISEPTTDAEATKVLENMAALADKEMRELTDDEASRYEAIQKKFNV